MSIHVMQGGSIYVIQNGVKTWNSEVNRVVRNEYCSGGQTADLCKGKHVHFINIIMDRAKPNHNAHSSDQCRHV